MLEKVIDYKVKDFSLADWGRKEINLAEAEMPGLMSLRKEYIGTIQLGFQTDSLDLTGRVIKELPVPKISKAQLKSILNKFIGDSYQIPPMFSALKKNGIPLYKLARKGIKVEREPRKIHIYDIELIKFQNNQITIRIECGKGTYIRSLAKDIAVKLNTCGYLTRLSRTKVGEYSKSDSIHIENLNEWLITIT